MARRSQAPIRKVEADPVYGNVVLTKLINRVMRDGKKSVARSQVYAAIEVVRQKTGKDPLEIFIRAIENIKPTMEVRPRRVGGAAYQVPMSVRGPRRESLAIRWLVMAAQARPNSEFHTFGEKLAAEVTAAAAGEGGAMKKKLDMERMAEANRAFAHFRW